MLATMVALLVVPLTMVRLSPARLATTIAMLALAGILAVAYVPQTTIERLATTKSEVEGGRVGGRFKLWAAGLRAFVRKPVMGYGPATFKSAITPDLGTMAQVAHNSFISVLVEEGIGGFLLYSTMLVSVFLSILSLPRLERRFGLVLFATLVVAMMPLTWEDRRAVWFILAALLGVAKSQVPVSDESAWRPDPRRGIPGERRLKASRRLEPLTLPDRNAGA
jgi:O-antigen ligase